jgi:hypothetical protein
MRHLSNFGTTDVKKALSAKQKRKFESIVDVIKELKQPPNDDNLEVCDP